jgi:Arc/MetJ-type ribon-helix-helix transcriptional regulator
MQVNVPPDLEALVQRRLATGAFANAEEVIRRALETLDAEESWTDEERRALDEKSTGRWNRPLPAGSTGRKKRGGNWPH